MTRTHQYRINGLCCGEEIAVLRNELEPLSSVVDLEFDLIKAQMTVEYHPDQLSSNEIIQIVNRTGMKAVPWEQRQAQPTGGLWERYGQLLTTVACGFLLIMALFFHWQGTGQIGPGNLPFSLYLLSTLCGAWFIAPKAWLALRRLRPDMNLLMMSAVVGAFLIGEFFEAAMVTFLFALSLFLEQWNVARARNAIGALLELTPVTARYRCEEGCCDSLTEKPVGEIPLGATVVVRPGERVPLDGEVVKGQSTVNQAPITGESMPVAKEPGEQVYAGTINQEGTLEFRADRTADDTQLARIVHMVESAQKRRAVSQQWVDRFSLIYTPLMMGLSLAVALSLPLLTPLSWTEGFYRGLVILVIACPCALVISTPVSIVAALASAARNGVLIKGGRYLEAAGSLRALAFDKTGTLTTGHPSVQHLLPSGKTDEDTLLATAAALEIGNDHPLARAIVRHAKESGIAFKPAEHFTLLPGKGGEGEIDGQRFWIGSFRLLEEKGAQSPQMIAQAKAYEAAGHSVVAVGYKNKLYGLISVADNVREGAPQVIQNLRDAGIKQIAMLTGDNKGTAQSIATELGLDTFYAELLPADKVETVEKLTQLHGAVAMVGDGINDAPAMAASTFGVAMGAMGTDTALETADMALMSDDLSKLPWLIRHARRTLRTIKQNIAFALGLKLLFFVLTLFGVATLWMAIIADTGTTLLVVFNSLRLLGRFDEGD